MYPTIEVSLFGVEHSLHIYPMFAILAMLVALIVMLILFHTIGYKYYEVLLIFSMCSAFFLIGARLLNYAINHQQYLEEGYSLFTFSFGHFSVYGGMIMAGLPALIWIKVFKKDGWLFADTVVFPFLISFAIMRIGCFLNGCCYGKVCTNFLGVPAPLSKVQIYEALNKFVPLTKLSISPVYPTQLMEMGFALLFIPMGIVLYRKYKGKGYVISLMIIYFSAFRLFVMFFRDLPYDAWVTGFAYPMLYSLCILLGLVLFVYKAKAKT